jgi:hypothetical protein
VSTSTASAGHSRPTARRRASHVVDVATTGVVLVLLAAVVQWSVPAPPAALARESAAEVAATDAGVQPAPVGLAGFRNGELPDSLLVPVAGIRLEPEAAAAFAELLAAARRDGASVVVTDGYRPYVEQVDVKRRKGWLAATPGTSVHGWGRAIDVHLGRTDLAWLHAHAPTFGWVNPAWAQPGGSKPEPWHWEYVGAAQPDGRLTDETPAAGPHHPGVSDRPPLAPGEVVARIRLEPADTAPGEWVEVREGLDHLADGPGHYPGTGMPGEPGNIAIAGYRREHGAPLRGLDRLEPGDVVALVVPSGEEHRFSVVARDDLSRDGGWAVGPDPLGTGAGRMLTLTSASADGGLLVVWAAS